MSSIRLPQGTVHYTDAGPRDAPVLVFVHGLLVSGSVWSGVVDALSDRYRCVVPDLPLGSHREGMAADADLSPRGVAGLVADFVAALDLTGVVLVGNDSGGAIAQLVVTERPERIGRLVLTTCDAFEVFPPKLFAYLSWLVRSPALVRLTMKAMLASPLLRRLPMAYGLLTKRPLDPKLSEEWVRPGAEREDVRRDVAKFIATVDPAVTMRAAAALPKVDMPALVLWAREDKSFALSLGERLAKTLPRARLELLDDAWVFAQIDRPQAVADAIASFVVQTANDAASARASTMLSSMLQ